MPFAFPLTAEAIQTGRNRVIRQPRHYGMRGTTSGCTRLRTCWRRAELGQSARLRNSRRSREHRMPQRLDDVLSVGFWPAAS